MMRRLQLGHQIADMHQVPKLDFSEDGKKLTLTFGIISLPTPIPAAIGDPEKNTHRDLKPIEGGSIYSSNLKASLIVKNDETTVLNLTMDVISKVPGTGG